MLLKRSTFFPPLEQLADIVYSELTLWQPIPSFVLSVIVGHVGENCVSTAGSRLGFQSDICGQKEVSLCMQTHMQAKLQDIHYCNSPPASADKQGEGNAGRRHRCNQACLCDLLPEQISQTLHLPVRISCSRACRLCLRRSLRSCGTGRSGTQSQCANSKFDIQ